MIQNTPPKWYLTLDLHGTPQDYPKLFKFLESLSAKQISKNIWWFVQPNTSNFDVYCNQLIAFIMQTLPNQPALRDTFMVSVGGKHYVASSLENLVKAGLAEAGGDKMSPGDRVYGAYEEVFELVADLPD